MAKFGCPITLNIFDINFNQTQYNKMLWSLANAIAVSQDCSNVINLAQSMKMSTTNINTLKTANCCKVVGVTCTPAGIAEEIHWESMGLTGTISNHFSKLSVTGFFAQNNELRGNLPAFPKTLQYVALENNKLSGKIPAFPNIYEGYFGNNQFQGKLAEFPSTLMYFAAQNNLLAGPIPKLPARMLELDLQSNQFTGGIPNLPDNLVSLTLANNELKGKLPASLPSTLENLNLNSNAFFGQLPTVFPKSLLELNLYNNDFTGNMTELPEGLRVLNIYNNDLKGSLIVNKPVQLIANINHFTEIVVKDQSQMVVCDLSNNPVWRSTLAPLEGNCRLYGTKKDRTDGLVKRSIEDESELKKRSLD